jgi:hypothetical protein
VPRGPASYSRQPRPCEVGQSGGLSSADNGGLGVFAKHVVHHRPGHRIHAIRGSLRPEPGGSMSTSRSTITRASPSVEVLADQTGATCAAFLERAVAWLPDAVWRSAVSSATTAVAMCDARLPPRVPLHSATLAHGPTPHAPTARLNASFRPCCEPGRMRTRPRPRPGAGRRCRGGLQSYNHDRPHASLGYQPPVSRLQSAA